MKIESGFLQATNLTLSFVEKGYKPIIVKVSSCVFFKRIMVDAREPTKVHPDEAAKEVIL
ncbi:hypothetical protein ACTHPF_16595 [Paenibacillus sp. SAF-054]|uniref:hypothetical protein n=1 Tax=unclassified Paenibacillus TaxID=185978 RepID=UPI003F819EE5